LEYTALIKFSGIIDLEQIFREEQTMAAFTLQKTYPTWDQKALPIDWIGQHIFRAVKISVFGYPKIL